ncbi:cobalt-precorrin-5B C(1)-methyltransferase CbiD [Gottschalkia purinilytica]|uniref:Cobalt-precorrin-5B C(1)-methyltransferase n=1 Tax=Gottschalkia purinilytica TaxID=1503 RepID=A0A0L0W754_GOTPU|nr:cobalt-precorrin-5B (C(1))-methyltransferase CbiD [Gottschalkia purinilytica]KNF07344.1 cobalt-precorrin-5B C(1)-methyltransferase CbiD [Gottschalkia purinilytica]
MKKLDMYVIKEGKKLRCGYTTGSCATGAAKAATIGLLTGEIPRYIEIDTPAGITLKLEVEKPNIGQDFAECCIVKDAGDDPDSTDGIEVFAKVSRRNDRDIVISGGIGIGRITRDGFWGKAGESAINPVPRKMIAKEVSQVTEQGLDILIYSPMGVEIGKKTFNSNIGIEDGISIIGTKGIVEPMSEDALKKSIYLEIDNIYDSGKRSIGLYPGNYGEKIAEQLSIKDDGVKISNFIGDSLLYCYNKGFEKITLVGHIGKFCKLSIGVFNTHSKTCDVRIESFIYYLAMNNAPRELILKLNECLTSEEALKIIIENGYEKVIGDMTKGCIDRIKRYLKDEEFDIDVVMYSMDYGVLLSNRRML